MPTLTQVRNTVDSQLATLWTAIQTRQDTYFATHGRYWQGKRTMSRELVYNASTDGSTVGDRLNDRPTDINESWGDLFPTVSGLSLTAVLWVDAYNGPGGHGYVAHVRVLYNGTVYTRSQNHGPETWRTQAWRSLGNEGSQW